MIFIYFLVIFLWKMLQVLGEFFNTAVTILKNWQEKHRFQVILFLLFLLNHIL